MKSEKSICDSFFEEKLNLDVCCVIAAAGLSSRMGCWKGDLKLGPEPGSGRTNKALLERAVDTAMSICSRVILVGGEQFPRIKELVGSREGLLLVRNEEYQKGMLSSIQRGLTHVESDFFILPMDMPLIESGHFIEIHKYFMNRGKERNRFLYRPVYDDVPGHPVFIPYSWKDRILMMKGSGLKGSLNREDQVLIPWKDESVILDLDTPESYERYIRDYGESGL